MSSNIKSASRPPEALQNISLRDLENPDAEKDFPYGGFRLPGVIDLHIHGGFGWDFSWGESERIEEMLDTYLSTGLTGIVATVMTCDEEQRLKALSDIRTVAVRRKRPPQILGISLEGPFLAPGRKGSHPKEHLLEPDMALLESWQKAAGGMIKFVTVAPELPGAIEMIKKAPEIGIEVSLGHTEADHATTMAALEAGAQNVTHFFNAMRPFTHRDPTAVSAIMTFKRAMVELIADCRHVHPDILKLSFSIFGHERISLVSDAVAPAGLPEGTHEFYWSKLELKDGACTRDGKFFGGARPLLHSLPNFLEKTGIAPFEASQCLSQNPCRALGIEPPRADVILDSSYSWLATRIEDTWYYRE